MRWWCVSGVLVTHLGLVMENFHYNMKIESLLLTAIVFFVLLEPSSHYDNCY